MEWKGIIPRHVSYAKNRSDWKKAIYFLVYTFFYFYLVRPLKFPEPSEHKDFEEAHILTSID